MSKENNLAETKKIIFAIIAIIAFDVSYFVNFTSQQNWST